jgi:hypothetical protein
VIQFPAWLTAGMHGIELRDQKCRALRFSAPLPTVSPLTESTLQSTPQPSILTGTGNS